MRCARPLLLYPYEERDGRRRREIMSSNETMQVYTMICIGARNFRLREPHLYGTNAFEGVHRRSCSHAHWYMGLYTVNKSLSKSVRRSSAECKNRMQNNLFKIFFLDEDVCSVHLG
jgi:hypothetical protein